MNVGQNDVRQISGIVQPESHGLRKVLIAGHNFVAGFAEENDSRFLQKARGKVLDNRFGYSRARTREHEPRLAVWEADLHSLRSKGEHRSAAEEVDAIER